MRSAIGPAGSIIKRSHYWRRGSWSGKHSGEKMDTGHDVTADTPRHRDDCTRGVSSVGRWRICWRKGRSAGDVTSWPVSITGNVVTNWLHETYRNDCSKTPVKTVELMCYPILPMARRALEGGPPRGGPVAQPPRGSSPPPAPPPPHPPLPPSHRGPRRVGRGRGEER